MVNLSGVTRLSKSAVCLLSYFQVKSPRATWLCLQEYQSYLNVRLTIVDKPDNAHTVYLYL